MKEDALTLFQNHAKTGSSKQFLNNEGRTVGSFASHVQDLNDVGEVDSPARPSFEKESFYRSGLPLEVGAQAL